MLNWLPSDFGCTPICAMRMTAAEYNATFLDWRPTDGVVILPGPVPRTVPGNLIIPHRR